MSFKIIRDKKCYRIYKGDTGTVVNTCFRSHNAAQNEMNKMVRNLNRMKSMKKKVKNTQKVVNARSGCGCH